ncbi:hypothetical protein MRX96_042262 [Rhipicephalus microplus]
MLARRLRDPTPKAKNGRGGEAMLCGASTVALDSRRRGVIHQGTDRATDADRGWKTSRDDRGASDGPSPRLSRCRP